ncbi:hypothetical protein HanIR_Chr07g0312601 [Helianthus annuus]|nr:hypothetical protein HanIR_Chr07g0312601 [Helianthus annuus]
MRLDKLNFHYIKSIKHLNSVFMCMSYVKQFLKHKSHIYRHTVFEVGSTGPISKPIGIPVWFSKHWTKDIHHINLSAVNNCAF